MKRILFVLVVALSTTACSTLGQLAWQAADQAGRYSAKRVVVDDIMVPSGHRAVRVVNGLNFPSAFTWDAAGNLYILESHTVPAPMLKPKIVRVSTSGAIDRVRLDGPNAPNGDTAIGLTFHDGWLYFSHEQKDATFSISRVRPEGGVVEPVVQRVPVTGDHDINHLLFAPDGTLYFGVGSATNSGVVASADPVNQKWLEKHPETHDIPCRDIKLTGVTFDDPKGKTGAYQPLGQSGAREIRGESMCTSAIYRLKPGSTMPELVAWGFRNPVALAIDTAGTLLVGMQGADERSTRPLPNDGDSVLRVVDGTWYGWPDYGANLSPVSAPPVIDHQASGLKPPDGNYVVGLTEPHAAISGMVFAPGEGLLVAEMGDFKPMTARDSGRAGFQVERLQPRNGIFIPFLRNKGKSEADHAQPASTLDLRNGFERPVDVRIGPDGLIYVLDFGAFILTEGEPKAFPKTGKLFRIEKAP
ncbi:MAG: PQQ-dependent sugar dehydrogenase [Thermoanaerobaculia bacterium]